MNFLSSVNGVADDNIESLFITEPYKSEESSDFDSSHNEDDCSESELSSGLRSLLIDIGRRSKRHRSNYVCVDSDDELNETTTNDTKRNTTFDAGYFARKRAHLIECVPTDRVQEPKIKIEPVSESEHANFDSLSNSWSCSSDSPKDCAKEPEIQIEPVASRDANVGTRSKSFYRSSDSSKDRSQERKIKIEPDSERKHADIDTFSRSWSCPGDTTRKDVPPKVFGQRSNNQKKPSYKYHQLLGDSQFVRFSDKLLHPRSRREGINRIGYCVSGQKIHDLKRMLMNMEYQLRPNVIVMIGTNDLVVKTKYEAMVEGYEAIVDILRMCSRHIVLLTVPPVPKMEEEPRHWEVLKKFNEFILRQDNGETIFCVDVASLYVTYHNKCSKNYYEPTIGNPARPDLIHLNTDGFRLLRAALDISYFNKQF